MLYDGHLEVVDVVAHGSPAAGRARQVRGQVRGFPPHPLTSIYTRAPEANLRQAREPFLLLLLKGVRADLELDCEELAALVRREDERVGEAFGVGGAVMRLTITTLFNINNTQ